MTTLYFRDIPIHECDKAPEGVYVTAIDKLLIQDGICPYCRKEIQKMGDFVGYKRGFMNDPRDLQNTYGQENFSDGKGRPRHGSPIFYQLLQEMAETHDIKSHDYASDSDPYGNYVFAGQLAVMFSHSPQDAGFVGRLAEKLYRIANLEKHGKTGKSENIEDTERDIAVIVTLWIASRRERRMANQSSNPLPGSIINTSADKSPS